MWFLLFFLVFVPITISVPAPPTLTRSNASKNLVAPGAPHIPSGAKSYNCRTRQGTPMKISAGETTDALKKACSLKNQPEKYTNYPKKFKPGYGQIMAFGSGADNFYLYPLNPSKYPDTFIVSSEDCGLASVMVGSSAALNRLPSSQLGSPVLGSVRTRPGSPLGSPPGSPGSPQSVRTRPGSPNFGQSVRTRPESPFSPSSPQSVRTRPSIYASQSDYQTGRHGRSASIKKRAPVTGGGFQMCQMSTYDWNSDVDGTGRQLGNVVIPGGRTPV